MVDISKIKIERIEGLDDKLNQLSNELTTEIERGVSIGDICYSLRTQKDGWLLCNGASYSTTTYANLFAIIGYTYGGSGANFNVPNYQGLFLQMKTASQSLGQKLNAGLPNITGSVYVYDWQSEYAATNGSGALYNAFNSSAGRHTSYGSGTSNSAPQVQLLFNAQRSNSIYGASSTVQPPAYTVNYFIKC